VKEYFVLGALCLSTSLHMLLSGCTMGLVSSQKETRSEQKIGTLHGMDKNWVKFRSKDGITTYIIRDRNGKMLGMRVVKEPWVNIPVPRCYPDAKTILVNHVRQEEVEKTKITGTQRLTSLLPSSETLVLSEGKKGSSNKIHLSSFVPLPKDEEMCSFAAPNTNKIQIDEKRDTEIRKRMSKEENNFNKEKREPVLGKYRHGKSMVERSPHEPGDDSDIGVKAGEKTYSLDMTFPAKWLPGFVLRSMDLKNGGDIKFKIPVPSSDWDVKFGLKFKSKRLELSNNSERIIMGLFTIAFGGKEHKKAANVAATDGSFF
jgi:hypothetical protein